MTTNDYQFILDKYKLTQDEAASLFRVHLRTSQRYAMGHIAIPGPLAVLLDMLGDGLITPQQIPRRPE